MEKNLETRFRAEVSKGLPTVFNWGTLTATVLRRPRPLGDKLYLECYDLEWFILKQEYLEPFYIEEYQRESEELIPSNQTEESKDS